MAAPAGTHRWRKALRSEPRFGTPELENSAEIGGHFHRQAISKSVIIVDVPIAIGRGREEGTTAVHIVGDARSRSFSAVN
jgi:hypothetical protein